MECRSNAEARRSLSSATDILLTFPASLFAIANDIEAPQEHRPWSPENLICASLQVREE
jgi:hypothetical protein